MISNSNTNLMKNDFDYEHFGIFHETAVPFLPIASWNKVRFILQTPPHLPDTKSLSQKTIRTLLYQTFWDCLKLHSCKNTKISITKNWNFIETEWFLVFWCVYQLNSSETEYTFWLVGWEFVKILNFNLILHFSRHGHFKFVVFFGVFWILNMFWCLPDKLWYVKAHFGVLKYILILKTVEFFSVHS